MPCTSAGLLGLVAHPIKGAFLSYDRWKRQGTDPLRPSRLQMGQDALGQSSDTERRIIVEAFQQAVLVTEHRKTKLQQEALLAMQDTNIDNDALSGGNTLSESGSSPFPPPYGNSDLPGRYREKDLPPTPSFKEDAKTDYFV